VPWLSALAGRSRHAAQHGADVGGPRCIPCQAVFPAGAHEGHRSRSNPLDRLKRWRAVGAGSERLTRGLRRSLRRGSLDIPR
jgi:hypothetical protein